MSSFWESEILLGEVEKNKKEKLVVKKVFNKGKDYIEVRTFFKSDDEEYKPSQKGIVLSYEKFGELLGIFSLIE